MRPVREMLELVSSSFFVLITNPLGVKTKIELYGNKTTHFAGAWAIEIFGFVDSGLLSLLSKSP